MKLGVRVDAFLGEERIGRGLPATSWQWSEKYPAIPSGVFTADFPGTFWPTGDRDALRPMGQWLRVEVLHDDRVTPLPPARIVDVSEQSGRVSVSCETLDLDIAEDPWPFPSSPATGSSFAREAARLAAPRRVRLDVPDSGLPDGLAWGGQRDEALLELAESHGVRWELDGQGVMVARPLGEPTAPDRDYVASEIVDSSRKAARTRVSKATITVDAKDDNPAVVITRRLTHPAYRPELYGTVGEVVSDTSGASEQVLIRRAEAMLAESGAQRDFTIIADPTLRAGMVARLRVERRDGRETVIGRVSSLTLNEDGTETITVQEAKRG